MIGCAETKAPNAAAVALVLATSLLTAAPPAILADEAKTRCEARKLNAAGKRHRCLARAAARAHRSKPADPAECAATFTAALDAADAKAAEKGTSCRFLDNGDGTISDLETGLMWEKKVEGVSCLHCVEDRYGWPEAMADWISRVNGRLDDFGRPEAGFGGHRDWRLPTTEALETISLAPFPCDTAPCIDPAFGPMSSSLYWSGSSFVTGSEDARVVSFIDGGRYAWATTFPWHVRAVRGGSP